MGTFPPYPVTYRPTDGYLKTKTTPYPVTYRPIGGYLLPISGYQTLRKPAWIKVLRVLNCI